MRDALRQVYKAVLQLGTIAVSIYGVVIGVFFDRYAEGTFYLLLSFPTLYLTDRD